MPKTKGSAHKLSTMAQRRQAVKTVFTLIDQCKKISDYALMKRYHTTRMTTRLTAGGYITPVENEPGYYWLTAEGNRRWNAGQFAADDLESIVNHVFQLKSRRDRGPVQTEINLDPGDMVPVGGVPVMTPAEIKDFQEKVETRLNTNGPTIFTPPSGKSFSFIIDNPEAKQALVNKLRKGLEMVDHYKISKVAEYLADFLEQ